MYWRIYKNLNNYPTVVPATIAVFSRDKRKREVTGDSRLRGTGCQHCCKMGSFVRGNALQCLKIRYYVADGQKCLPAVLRLPSHYVRQRMKVH